MIVRKSQIIEILRSRGQDARADWVNKELPSDVDTVHHAGILVTLRIDQAELLDVAATEPTSNQPT